LIHYFDAFARSHQRDLKNILDLLAVNLHQISQAKNSHQKMLRLRKHNHLPVKEPLGHNHPHQDSHLLHQDQENNLISGLLVHLEEDLQGIHNGIGIAAPLVHV
jgi:hypothetical protein